MEIKSNDSTKNIVLSLELLSKEYNVVLIQYNQAQQNYIDFLQSQKDSSVIPLTVIKGSIFLGTNRIREKITKDIEECKALCSADKSCSGATFQSSSKYCMTRTGEGSIMRGTTNDNAIIPVIVNYLNIIKVLNEKLSDINKKILLKTKKADPLYSQQSNERKKNNIILTQNYDGLQNERKKIEQLIEEQKGFVKQEEIGAQYISQKHALFIISTIILFIIIFLFFKIIPSGNPVTNIQYGGDGVLSKKVYILIFIMILITLVTLKITK